jgi:nitrous oxide reductase
MKQFLSLVTVLLALGLIAGCGGKKGRTTVRSDVQEAAQRTYVAPGDLDEFYTFKSGGHSGQVYVYGVPSMRHLSTIPVFAPYAATGYGYDKESKAMLGAHRVMSTTRHQRNESRLSVTARFPL